MISSCFRAPFFAFLPPRRPPPRPPCYPTCHAGGREVARLELVVVLLLVGVVDVAARREDGEEDGDERGAVDRREGEDDELAHPERWRRQQLELLGGKLVEAAAHRVHVVLVVGVDLGSWPPLIPSLRSWYSRRSWRAGFFGGLIALMSSSLERCSPWNQSRGGARGVRGGRALRRRTRSPCRGPSPCAPAPSRRRGGRG